MFTPTVFYILGYFRHVLILTYLSAAFSDLHNYRKGIREQFSPLEKISLAWLRIVLIGYSIAWIVSFVHFSIFITAQKNPPIFEAVVYTLFFAFFNVIYYFGFRQPEIFAGIDQKKPYSKSILSEEKKAVFAGKLKNYVNNHKPQLKPALTLEDLASSLEIPSRYLSQIINESFGMSFYDYINGLRINEFKSHMLDSTDDKMTILEGLYAVGFNSKSSFPCD